MEKTKKLDEKGFVYINDAGQPVWITMHDVPMMYTWNKFKNAWDHAKQIESTEIFFHSMIAIPEKEADEYHKKHKAYLDFLGIESLKAAVKRDCDKANKCFKETGCNHDHPECSHRYCDKYKWIIERAQHYAEKTNSTFESVLKSWETDRTYWYMNYYQECNQPLLEDSNLKIWMYNDWLAECEKRFGKDSKKWAFICPSCGNIQTIQDFLDNNIENPEAKIYTNCIGRYVGGKGCDWTLGGLFKIHKELVIQNGNPIPVFQMAEADYQSTKK